MAAGKDESASSREALEKLCRAYWRPIYTYVRRRGHAPPEAEDLTQAFFAHFLERKLLTVVDRELGRFRTFVLHACEYFLAKHWRDASRLTPEPTPWLETFQTVAIWVSPVVLQESVCRDRKDDKFIEAALGAECALLVARDRDLTILQKPFGISILTPRAFLAGLSRAERRRLA